MKEKAHLLFSDLDTEASQQKTTNVIFLMSTQLLSTELQTSVVLYFTLFQCEEEILQFRTSVYRMLSLYQPSQFHLQDSSEPGIEI